MLRKVSDLHIGGGKDACTFCTLYLCRLIVVFGVLITYLGGGVVCVHFVLAQIDCCIWGMGASKIAHFLSLN